MAVIFGNSFGDLSRQMLARDQIVNSNNERALDRQLSRERMAQAQAQFQAQRADLKDRAALAQAQADEARRTANKLKSAELEYKKNVLTEQKRLNQQRQKASEQAAKDKAAAAQAKAEAKAEAIRTQGDTFSEILRNIHLQRSQAQAQHDEADAGLREIQRIANNAGYETYVADDDQIKFRMKEGTNPANAQHARLLLPYQNDLDRFYKQFNDSNAALEEADKIEKTTMGQARGAGFVSDPYGQFLTSRDGQRFQYADVPNSPTISQAEAMQRFPLVFNPPPVTEFRAATNPQEAAMANEYQQQLAAARQAGLQFTTAAAAPAPQMQPSTPVAGPSFDGYRQWAAQRGG